MTEEKQYLKISEEELKKYLNDKEVFIVDTREIPLCKKGFLQNSIIIPLSMSYSVWFPAVITNGSKVIIITDKEHEKESLEKTSLFNSYNILGYVLYEELIENNNNFVVETIEYNSNTKEELQKLVDNKNILIDIREMKEFKETGVLKDALLIPLSGFQKDFNKIPKNGNIYVYCRSGMRAITGMTFAKREGYKNKFIIMEGGMMKIIKEGFPVIPFSS